MQLGYVGLGNMDEALFSRVVDRRGAQRLGTSSSRLASFSRVMTVTTSPWARLGTLKNGATTIVATLSFRNSSRTFRIRSRRLP